MKFGEDIPGGTSPGDFLEYARVELPTLCFRGAPIIVYPLDARGISLEVLPVAGQKTSLEFLIHLLSAVDILGQDRD